MKPSGTSPMRSGSHFKEKNMPFCHSTSCVKSAWSRQFLLILALCVFASWPAFAQVSVSLSTSTTFKPDTPREVKSGTATLVEHYNPNQKLRLTIGLQPPHVEEERQFLQELQKPRTKGSANSTHALSAAEWTSRFDPSVEDEKAVVDWAIAQGFTVTRRFPNRLLVDVEAPAATIEKAFNVTMNSYQIGTKTFFSNDRDPQIPSNLTSILHSVGGLNSLQVLRPANKNAQEPTFPDYTPGPAVSYGQPGGGDGDASKLPQALKKSHSGSSQVSGTPNYTGAAPYDPEDMYSTAGYSVYALYGLGHCCNPTGNPSVTPPETSIAIATAGAQQGSDFTGFHDAYPYLAWHYEFINIDGTPTCCDAEGTMDFEWSTAMSNSFGAEANTAMVYLYDGVNSGFGTFNDIYNSMLTDGYARNFSTSWGWVDATLGGGNMDTADAIFSSMVGQGWSLTAASGDGGASYSCQDFDSVSFPASDPHVVAAGGATLYMSGGPPPTFDSIVGWSGGPDGCSTNDGGSTGGYSSYWSTPTWQSALDLPSRGVPDIALNADWYNTPQYLYFEGGLSGNGGTSIVAPETVGFFAQENAYLLALGNICGDGTEACSPMGSWSEVNPILYNVGENNYDTHNPFYDITSGCNNNNITALDDLNYYCAGVGWDPVTGWGAYNFLQLAWAINYSVVPGDSYPVVTFSGPTTNQWYNSDQEVTWTISSPANISPYPSDGLAGFAQQWDSDPGDPTTEATPGYAGFPSSPYNAFYDGPQYYGSSGCLDITASFCNYAGGGGQGWQTVYIRAWGNEGENTLATYGPIGYDTIPPVATASVAGTKVGSYYENLASVTLHATDPGYTSSPQTGSGVANIFYQVNGGTWTTYSVPFLVGKNGANTVNYYATDNAGNVGSTQTLAIGITDATTTALTSSLNPSGSGKAVTFTATVTPVSGTATGSVTFKDGATVLGTTALSGGKATYSTSALAVGSNAITATFLGSTYFLTSVSGTVTQVVKADSTTTVTSSANPSAYDQAVTFTATITHTATPTPTGTVTFKNGTTTLATVTVSGGKATYATSALAVGTHSITAVYSGNVNYIGSTSAALSHVVDKAGTSTTVVSSLNPSDSGSKVTFTATVKSSTTGTPTGTVTFKNGSTTLGTGTLSSGKATYATSTLAVGTHSITAVYEASTDFNTSTSAVLSQKVNE
jgi:Bacterial Ig-like domain (group 3)/Pro-kumamolisin, activation domain